MQDPDPKCRHFGILWHFGIFAKKSDRKSDPIFRLFPTFRLSDSTALIGTHIQQLLGCFFFFFAKKIFKVDLGVPFYEGVVRGRNEKRK